MTNPQAIQLSDYKKPAYQVQSLDLAFDLDSKKSFVRSKIRLQRVRKGEPLVLNGEQIGFLEVSVDGQALTEGQYELSESSLTLHNLPDQCEVEVYNHFSPEENTALEGIYQAGKIICSQNEPEGFRRITYFLDRPDVMTCFKTTLRADKQKFPYLLSNGNLIEEGELEDGRHYAVWEDPFPKPTYLFAVVAGDLGRIEDHFITASGKRVLLEIYSDPGRENQCLHAMEALKKAMKWDEETFGLEYDLERYMIVAVDAFNMGAMENKGLNIFNASCVLADEHTATDANYKRIEEVVSHEYFHNWTGNRVTCRDWFQLTLKEGLTVYRDQEFTADLHSRAVERIAQARYMVERQFPEDAGPMAHPIKPASYVEINNFYSSTVYHKGAEVIRMVEKMIGKPSFRKGLDTYFQLYDGQAVTTEDFLHAMEQASDFSFAQFQRWYHQAGTPKVHASLQYDAKLCQAKLVFRQEIPKTLYGGKQEALHFPFAYTLYGQEGVVLYQTVHEIKRMEEEIVLNGIAESPILSLNQGFTAPVNVSYKRTFSELCQLFRIEKDPYNKWQAFQDIWQQLILEQIGSSHCPTIPKEVIQGLQEVLTSDAFDPSYKAELLHLPSKERLFDQQNPVDVESTLRIADALAKQLSDEMFDLLRELYQQLASPSYCYSPKEMGQRSLKNQLLALLAQGERSEGRELALQQFKQANNMTDRYAALSILVDFEGEEAIESLQQFYEQGKDQPLVINKWLALHAKSKRKDTFSRVQNLIKSSCDQKVPNQVRALLGTFSANPYHFHMNEGKTYQWVADHIRELDSINPQIAAGLLKGYSRIRIMDSERKQQMLDALKSLESTNLSKDCYEIVAKTLQQVGK